MFFFYCLDLIIQACTRFGPPDVDSGPQYNEDDIKIEWHPRANKEPEIIPFEEWGQRVAPKPTIVTDKTPWYPYFQTREDFELADIF